MGAASPAPNTLNQPGWSPVFLLVEGRHRPITGPGAPLLRPICFPTPTRRGANTAHVDQPPKTTATIRESSNQNREYWIIAHPPVCPPILHAALRRGAWPRRFRFEYPGTHRTLALASNHQLGDRFTVTMRQDGMWIPRHPAVGGKDHARARLSSLPELGLHVRTATPVKRARSRRFNPRTRPRTPANHADQVPIS